MTEWRQCVGYPDYEINEFGALRRLTNSHGRWKIGREKATFMRNGYLFAKMPGNRSMKVHRLVAFTFVGPQPSPKHEVAHGDGNKLNNHYSNLRWATRQENMRDAISHGTAPYGANSGRAKLTWEQIENIRHQYSKGDVTQASLARQYGVAPSHICGIVRGKFWPVSKVA